MTRNAAQTLYPTPRNAMVLAAGLGRRMRPLTDTVPKPLVPVVGKPLIDYALDALTAANVGKVVVNVHYLAEQVERHVARRKTPRVVISDEREALLDSGGGIRKALPELGANPFYLINSDSFWLEGSRPNLQLLTASWQDDQMDILLLLAGMQHSVGYHGNGDFTMDPEGRLTRRAEREVAPFAYAGAAIFHPRVFADAPEGPFSLNILFDRAIEAGRLYGVRMAGLWLHVGTPEAVYEAETAIARSAA